MCGRCTALGHGATPLGAGQVLVADAGAGRKMPASTRTASVPGPDVSLTVSKPEQAAVTSTVRGRKRVRSIPFPGLRLVEVSHHRFSGHSEHPTHSVGVKDGIVGHYSSFGQQRRQAAEVGSLHPGTHSIRERTWSITVSHTSNHHPQEWQVRLRFQWSAPRGPRQSTRL